MIYERVEHMHITEPYTLNTSLVHDVLDTVAAAVERIDHVLLAFAGLRDKTGDFNAGMRAVGSVTTVP